MKNYSILGTKPQTISPISRSFIILNRGRATITLNPDGVVTTFSATVPDGTIKRDSQYKSVLYELSEQMIKAYEAQTLTFLQLHRKLKKTFYSKKSYENKIDKIEKKTYKRRSFTIPEPTSKDVSALLCEEAKGALHNSKDDNTIGYQKFTSDRLQKVLSDRKAKWEEVRRLFFEIEDAREQKINAQYQREYDAQREKELNYVNGEPSVVDDAIDKLSKELEVPFNFGFNTSYSQETGTLDVNVELRENLDLPLLKAEMLSSGKISIKNKLVREITQQTTETIFSFVFYFAGKLFGTSPNIEHVRMCVWDAGKQNGLLWIDFNRTAFARNISPSMVPTTDIQVYNYPNVYDLRTRNTALELNPITSEKFMKRIKDVMNEI